MCKICDFNNYGETFLNIECLDISNCPNVTSDQLHQILYLSKIKQLIAVDCPKLTYINLCGISNILDTIDIQISNNIEIVDVTNCELLKYLNISNTSVNRIDLTKNIYLRQLQCSTTKIDHLDLSKNIYLVNLYCVYTHLEYLDISCLTYLDRLDCGYCKNLKEIKIYNKVLNWIDCRKCPVKNIDISNCQIIQYILLANCPIESLDISKCKFIALIDISYCRFLLKISSTHQHTAYDSCPWIPQNKEFPDNLQNLIRIQRWYRRILIIKYIKSREFIEWIYTPNNIGGLLYKKHLLNSLKM